MATRVILTEAELKRLLEMFDDIPQKVTDQNLWLKLKEAFDRVKKP